MITFVIFTYNEEKRIERVIKNFKDYGKILLADNKSTDKTHEIANKYGCGIYLREKDYVFVENQELVDELYKVIDTEWVYWGFADEMLEKETLQELKNITEGNQYDVISMDRKNYFYGEFCYNLYHARTFKLFKKDAINFIDNPIHSMGKANVPENRIYHLEDKYFIHHFISNTALSYLNVINRYTDSELNFPYQVKTSSFYLVIQFFKSLLLSCFRSKGFKPGYSSLALTELMLIYGIIKNMKHYEKQSQLTSQSIEIENNQFRDQILSKLS
ncbi:MAG TPA: glycosyltransferase [Ignavibacteriaceae bacterium]